MYLYDCSGAGCFSVCCPCVGASVHQDVGDTSHKGKIVVGAEKILGFLARMGGPR